MSTVSMTQRPQASMSEQQRLTTEFERMLGHRLDDFQREACHLIEQGQSILVAAPTGAGKTVVAEFAIELAMRDLHERVFYTAPIKALSNQKYQELCARYGTEQVGLLTGDTVINADARIIVMTTEVLRNMIYASSDALVHLAFVILDEVHYLADKFRGAVWEEVILHLPRSVRLISLSATVSNAEEFGEWLNLVRGETAVVVSEHRPVPLHQHVLAPNGLIPLLKGAAVHPEVQALKRAARSAHGNRSGHGMRGQARQAARSRTISRSDAVRVLEENSMLPAIFFVFSRKGCDEAVAQCLRNGLRLTNNEEAEAIHAYVHAQTAQLTDDELDALNYREWLSGLRRGFAAHHAGMIPLFKEIVEYLFQQRLVRVVFATETLALGINMPARSVVIEKLEKFNGEARVPLTSGEFTQLTGRAGRRGIDHEGHAIVLWHDSIDPEQLAHLVSKRSYPLLSSFKPTYNMSVNLIDAFGFNRARELLERSFAQFQADRASAGLAERVREQEESLAGYQQAMTCDRGDFREYSALQHSIRQLEKGQRRTRARARDDQRGSAQSLPALRKKLSQHPCHSCPDRQTHARWSQRWWELRRRTDNLIRQLSERTGNIARRFDRVVGLLSELGYVTGTGDETKLTELGHLLKRIYGERDLLVAESLRRDIWNELSPAGFAALVSTLAFEPRGDEGDRSVRALGPEFVTATKATWRTWAGIDELEERFRLDQTEAPRTTVAEAFSLWARDAELSTVLDMAELTAGDFVRIAKQVIDLLDQIAQVADGTVAELAADAKQLVRRGIVLGSQVSS